MKIMLACCLGMSTSVVVQKMKDAAKEQGKDYEIWAVDQNKIAENVGNFDVLLLGPQCAICSARSRQLWVTVHRWRSLMHWPMAAATVLPF